MSDVYSNSRVSSRAWVARTACQVLTTMPSNNAHDTAPARAKRQLVPAPRFLKSIGRARRTGDDRFVVQVPLEVRGQTVGRLVAARAVLLQALHHDPVEIAVELDAAASGVG